ncbi:MAG TPA: 4-(cytidine 5'-diphospho)-2-C-methyl-D-erythritol kinase [Stellaceae bacterium]|nr:4-(cytidine 5'-diphospho)-2-C-methyl-D-erythritol kinase [Stellaceae bacterium]
MARSWFAPAKLNLYLHVVGRRADGYHLLDSLVAFAGIGDEVAAAPAPALSLSLEGPAAPALAGPVEENLVWRAAELLAAAAGRAPAASLTLTKRLPVASGIGGGSSDAAATLRALTALWRLGFDEGALSTLGARLGADVPVCLIARAAWLAGIGEAVEAAAKLPQVAALLVNPGVALATPAVFKARQGPFSAPARFEGMPADAAGLVALLAARRNDLTAAALTLAPEIGRVLDRLARLEGALLARMSGSGATCFALFAEAAAAEAAAARLGAEEPHWWVAAAALH